MYLFKFLKRYCSPKVVFHYNAFSKGLILSFLIIILLALSDTYAVLDPCSPSPGCAEWGRPEITSYDGYCFFYCFTYTHYHLDGCTHTWIYPSCTASCPGWANYPPDWENWWFADGTDMDDDGFQAIGSCVTGDDCDDNDPNINPGAQEICDGKDNDCDGLVDEDCTGDDSCEENPNTTNMGSSANLASGNLYHSQQILDSQGRGLLARITISYNSLDTTIGPLGRGWTHNYNTNIIVRVIRKSSPFERALVLVKDDGKRVYFYETDEDIYTSDPSSGEHSSIIKNPNLSYTLTEKTGTIYEYDSDGKLTSITDRNNNTVNLTYTEDNLTLITDSSGRETTLVYDANNRITSITDPAGRTTTFTYNGDYLSTVTDPLGGTWTYTYDADGIMLTNTDPLGRTTTYTYDANGRIISSVDSEGNTKTISYNQVNQTTTITEKNGAQWTYVYDNTLNVPTEVTDPLSNQTTYQYDSNRNLLSKTEPDGRITTYTYDTDGNMLTKTEAQGTADERTTTYTYNNFGQVLTITDPDGNTTTYTYDANGNLLQETDAQGNITSHTYGSNGERLTTTDPNGNTTTYTYDQYGNVVSVTNALDQTITYTYDIMGNLLLMTDANGNTTTYKYDLKDRLIKETKPDGGIITYEYDLAGNRTATTDANGNRTTFTYDSLNRLIKTTDPEGNSINYTYDSESNITSMTIKDSSDIVMMSTSYTYDDYNRLIKTTHADGTYTEQSYDTNGNVLTKRDENGNMTTFTYDALNRLLSVTDPNGGVTSYTYDSRNNLLTVTDANANTTTYTYNSLNRLISTTSPDTGTTTYSYDPNGNLISKTDANGVTITYTYDALNRLTAIQFPDSTQNITYTYDNPQYQNSIGKLTSMTDQSGTTWYDYDKMGRIIMETKQINGLYYRTQYSYDLNGNLETITYPGGRIITYAYNQLNKITSVTETLNGVTRTLVNNITYLPFGDVLSLTHGNGIVTTKIYNNRYQLTDLDIGTLKDLSYTRDNTGNITSITDNLDPSKTKTYTYDNLYRLTQAVGSWGTLTYTYDPVGNRTNETTDTGNTTYDYTPNTNKLTTASGEKAFNFSYDSNGNTTVEDSRQYIYNQNQRLIKAIEGSDVLGEYIYNGNGQRVKKYTDNGTRCTVYHYDQNGLLIAESTSTGTIKAEYVYLNGQPLAMIENNNIYYYHNDHVGTPMLMTDETASQVWEGEYLPFGEPLSVSGTVTNNLRFPGQYYDAETGLHYNYLRDYKPEIGRYVEADPILQPMVNLKLTNSSCSKTKLTWRVPGLIFNPANLHPFVYTRNNVINYIDPYGLLTWDDIKKYGKCVWGCIKDTPDYEEFQRRMSICKGQMAGCLNVCFALPPRLMFICINTICKPKDKVCKAWAIYPIIDDAYRCAKKCKEECK